ncbi:MAG TPA: hypothetical protein VEZ70_07500 [Allosphingosinicella sp.]|jgi:hypothetical protein|nr:hypothetical protein [Allosphingosinicella sp.]
MISTVLAFALASAAQGAPADNIARARKEYSACLSGFMKKSLKEDMEETAFAGGLGPACTAQEQKFRAAVISADTAAGLKRAAAEENAGTEVDDIRANQVEMFKDYKSTNTRPGA